MPASRMKRSSKKKHIHKHKQRNTRKQQRHNKHTKKPPHKKPRPHRPPRQLLSKAPPCERILRRVYPTLRVHPLTSSIKEALVQKFKQRIPFSKWGDKTGKQGITYWELFRALSGYNHKKNEHHLVLIKGGFVRDIVQGKSLDERRFCTPRRRLPRPRALRPLRLLRPLTLRNDLPLFTLFDTKVCIREVRDVG